MKEEKKPVEDPCRRLCDGPLIERTFSPFGIRALPLWIGRLGYIYILISFFPFLLVKFSK